MTHHSFQIGIQDVCGYIEPVFYTPSIQNTESEGVLIYGNNYDLSCQIASKIIYQSVLNEQYSWIILHTNPIFLSYFRENEIIFQIGKESASIHLTYQLPIRFCTPTILQEMFGWSDEVDETYTLIWEDYTHDPDHKTSLDFYAFLEQYDAPPIYLDIIKTYFNQYAHLFTSKKYSVFGTYFIHQLKQRKSHIFHFQLPIFPHIKIIPFYAMIINEIKSLLQDCFIHGLSPCLGLCVDNIEKLLECQTSRTALHDALFSWGRTNNMTRILISQKSNPPSDILFRDMLDQRVFQSASHTLNPVYQMMFQTDTNSFTYLNRLIPHSIQESHEEGNATILPAYYEQVRLDSNIYQTK